MEWICLHDPRHVVVEPLNQLHRGCRGCDKDQARRWPAQNRHQGRETK
jgi:hypothetical protein